VPHPALDGLNKMPIMAVTDLDYTCKENQF